VVPPVSSGSQDQTLDAGNIGSTIGGEGVIYPDPLGLTSVSQSGISAAVAAVVTIILAFAMLRWSRRRKHLYHNNELGEIVPSLPYRKRNANAETASVDSSEFDVSV